MSSSIDIKEYICKCKSGSLFINRLFIHLTGPIPGLVHMKNIHINSNKEAFCILCNDKVYPKDKSDNDQSD